MLLLLPADLINVFEVFLPQLLLYPNPTDPLNGEAAALLMREPAKYNTRVKGEPSSSSCRRAGVCVQGLRVCSAGAWPEPYRQCRIRTCSSRMCL